MRNGGWGRRCVGGGLRPRSSQPAIRRLLLWLEPELEPVTHRAGALTVGPRTVRRAPLSRGRPPGSEGRGAGRAGACGSEPGRSPPAVPPARRRGPCPSATAAGPDTSPRGAVSRLCTARRLRRRVSSPSGHLVAERFADGHSIPGKRDFMRADRVDSSSVCLRLWRGERAAESGAHGGGGPAMVSVGNASPQAPLTPSGFELTRGHWIVL